MFVSTLSIAAVLAALIALSEWLATRTWLRHFGAALLVIVLTAIVANLGVIPTYGPETPLYGAIFTYVAPLGIFWLLLLVDLRSLGQVGGPTLLLFLLGSLGTALGAATGHWVVGGADALGDQHAALAGMFTGTYIGGSVNYNAVALEYGVMEDAALYAGAAAVDNAMTTVWMVVCVTLPRLLVGFWPKSNDQSDDVQREPVADDGEVARIFDLAAVIALGIAAVGLSELLANLLKQYAGLDVPSVLMLSTLALVLAQLPVVQRLKGARLLGLLAVYLFLAVIGSLCDAEALMRMGELAPVLGVFVVVLVSIHGTVVFGAARLLKADLETAAVASQANIGGGTSALALARSLGRGDLELPAILVGSAGLALGNYMGFTMVGLLGG
ncbi:DUF819 family protein [Congregibacter brevis]|uniref:DUF819 family protein n=1 Tax=Congregibacter brevis TaxID=3081201 RepID=A0ABZ0IC35_9GAMM|nr:DUF819 family protein [Congregibacter sp. IMCC45268]